MNREKLMTMLDEQKYGAIMLEMENMNAVDAAELFSYIDNQQIPRVFRLLKKDNASEIFAELDSEIQEKIITSMSDKELSRIMDELFIDDAVDMLEELPANVVNRILKSSSKELRQELNRYLNYPDNSAGSIMTSEVVSIHATMTVNQAVERIRKTGVDKETVYVIYVTDNSRILKGIVELRDLLFAKESDKIEDIMDNSIVSVHTLDDRECAVELIQKYDLLALPVVDSENRLVGIITVDDAMDVLLDEAVENIEIMAAISPTDKPYLKTGVFETWLKRIPWLLILMLSSTFTGAIINHYEGALGAMVILTSFIPMLMGTGGNAGGQASATIICGLSNGELRMGNILRIIWKEFRVSILCGATLSVATFAKVMLIDQTSVEVAFVVSITLLLSIIVAKFVGATLPILAKRIGFDPAVTASPFITTFVDALSLIIYFAIATSVLGL